MSHLKTIRLSTCFLTAAAMASFLLCLQGIAQAQTADFNFDNTPVGTPSPLVLTQNGITATFTDDYGLPHPGGGVYDDGQYAVEASNGGSLYSSAFSGNDLSSYAGYDGTYHPLVILFSQPIYSISLNYAAMEAPSDPGAVQFSAYDGAGLVGTQSLTPTSIVFFPEGKLQYTNTQGFTSIELAADIAPYLVVDNVEVSDVHPVPEASTVVSLGMLLVLGFGGLVFSARRRHRQTAR
jgi:hypothetical protein